MRAVLAALLLLASGCQRSTPEGAELTRTQCAAIVEHVQRLESADTGGLRLALAPGRAPDIEGCLLRGTDRAYRCVLEAEAAKDLESCQPLFK